VSAEAAKVSVRARFERFPATVKGALVLRGEDRDPHQVVLREARAVGIAGQEGRPITLAPVTLDVAPRRDIFVPFELQVTELEPGWYGLECDLDVDGIAGTFPGGKLFAVAWPRATVRRGQIRVDREVKVGTAKIVVEQVECGGDSIKVHLVAAAVPTMRLSAGKRKLELLGTEHDESSGRTKVTAYPLMKSDDSMRIELKAKGRGIEATLDIALP
jgi:hypothetical protein